MKKNKIVPIVGMLLAGCVLLGGCAATQDSSNANHTNANKTKTVREDAQKEPDEIRWYNASFAILTEMNGKDYNTYGGGKIDSQTQKDAKKNLDEAWGITNREDAEEMIDILLFGGHRVQFQELAAMVAESGIEEVPKSKINDFMASAFEADASEIEQLLDIYNTYKKYGEHAIDAWDYCRAIELLSFYYTAGYYTKEEAVEASKEFALLLQENYNSWDEVVDSYLRGYEFMSHKSSDERRAVYEKLLKRKDNPYNVDFNLKFN